MSLRTTQRGSVMIVTLWTITLMTILVAVLASQSRLSARVALAHQEEVHNWAAIESAVNQAEMDVLLQRMPPPAQESEEFASFEASMEALGKTPLYRFDGSPLDLYYPQPEGFEVRIYDHAGKINLQNISRPKLRSMIEKKLGGPRVADQQQIDDMMEAWNDWIDLNDGAAVNGAEIDYYQAQALPYVPRNGTLETVEELLQIRGFAEVFGDVNLDAAFTIYGEEDLINLNLATIDAMQLLPGLDEDLIGKILSYRAEKEFVGNGDVAQVVPAETMAELRPWLNSRKQSDYYSIMVYPRAPAAADTAEGEVPDAPAEISTLPDGLRPTAYTEVIRVTSQIERPQVLKINPYQALPLQESEVLIDEDTP